MGVLDGLSNNSGGLLNGLPSWWQYQALDAKADEQRQRMTSLPPPQTIAAAPQVGGRLPPRTAAGPVAPAMSIASASAPAADPAPPQAPLSGFFNRLADGLHSIGHGGSLAGAIRGHYDDAASQQAQARNLTAKALLARGIDPQAVNAAVQPGNGELLKKLIAQAYGPQLVQSLANGYRSEPRDGGAQVHRPAARQD